MRAITGEIFMVAVDSRKNSPTFVKWVSVILSSKKKNMFYVPRGCAASRCTLTDDCNLAYLVDNFYAPNNEDNILWNDPILNIKWPISEPAIISEKDKNAQSFQDFIKKSGRGLVIE